jgi:outer membrane protein assembly factor BamB
VFVAQSAWSQRADQLDPAAAAQYAIADGDIVYYQRNGFLIAFDAVTRRTRWKERQPWLFTASEGVVFTSTKTGRIAARRASDRR